MKTIIKFFPIQSILLFSFLITIITSCHKDKTPSPETDPTRNVFVAGFDNGKVVYWKNGIENVLSTTSSYNGNAYGIALSGSDVYTVGYVNFPAIVWKNGVRTDLTDGTSFARAQSILVNNNDVYISGYELGANSNYAVYWKNGVKTILAATSSIPSVSGIFVSGNDVYVSGTFADTALYWKNGVRSTLAIHNSTTSSIAVKGTDVYVAGLNNSNAVLWKNGVMTTLSSKINSQAYGIAIVGTDVYVVGTLGWGSAAYWKNGVENIIETSPTGYATANAIAAIGSDIYIAGQVNGAAEISAVYWKNNQRVTLGSIPAASFGTVSGNAIQVVNK